MAIDIFNTLGNAELALAIESIVFDTNEIMEYMKTKIPDYMIPAHIKFIQEFPYNSNGKIDRNKLRTYFKIENNFFVLVDIWFKFKYNEKNWLKIKSDMNFHLNLT